MKKLVQKLKDTLSIFSSSKGFTLLELLVVVLIIGILASIALPQYRFAVAKSKYNTLKSTVRSIADSANRFYLANNEYPHRHEDLDIDFNLPPSSPNPGASSFTMIFPNVKSCTVWNTSWNKVMCGKDIMGKSMRYYMSIVPPRPSLCYTESIDTTDVYNKLCQQETNKTSEQADCYDTYCLYSY